MRRAVAEVGRALRAEGLFVGTLLSTRAWKYGDGRRLEPSTYVQERGPESGVVQFADGNVLRPPTAEEAFGAFERVSERRS